MAFQTDMLIGCDGLFICMAQWANNVTDGWFWSLITMGLGIVLFMATYRFGTNRAFGFASFVTGSISLILVFLNLMQWYVASIFIVIMVLGIVAMRMME